MFGADKAGLIGTTGFFLSGNYYDVETIAMFFFQSVFMATSATIVSGAIAERTKFKAYCVYSFVISLLIYPLFGHWTWGGGWLWTLPFGSGYRDFAGSGVVHLIGGGIALAALLLMGPRLGKYKKDGTPNAIPGHSITLVIMGTFFLFFGWFGFNPGSTFGATDLRIGIVAVATALARCCGCSDCDVLYMEKVRKAGYSDDVQRLYRCISRNNSSERIRRYNSSSNNRCFSRSANR